MFTKNKNNKFNETKYLILRCLAGADKYLTPSEIAWICGLTIHATKCALTRLYNWHYIWRSIDRRKRTRSWYRYRHIKPKGSRVLDQLDYRARIGANLNLRKPK